MVSKVAFIFSVVFPLFSGEVLSSSKCRMNIVMGTDSTYLLPTMVAIHSIKKANKNCALDFSIFTSGLSEERRSPLTGLCESGCVHFNEIGDQGELSRLLDKVGKSIATNDRTPNKFIALKFLLPDILRARDLPSLEQEEEEENWCFEPFLWLDSDLIVNEHCKKPGLDKLYQACLELKQPIIGSDLLLFYGKNPRQLQGVLEKDGAEPFFKTVNEIPGGDNSRMSGGVVFWNPEILPEVKAPTRKMGGRPGRPPAVGGIYSALASSNYAKNVPPLVPFFDPNNRTEEGAMDRILGQWVNQGNKVQFFSTIYNCRPCCLQNGKDVNNVVVIHWDSDPPYTQKPWEVTADDKATLPERLWWTNFDDLVKAYPSVLETFTGDPILEKWNAWHDFLQLSQTPDPEEDGDDGTD